MISLDLSRDWIIIAPRGGIPEFAAAELSRTLGLLRGQAGASPAIPVLDAASAAPEDTRPLIALNDGGPGRENGYSWRVGLDRIEIFGTSGRGLLNGVFSFLASLGLRWPDPDTEALPQPLPDGAYALSRAGLYQPSVTDPAAMRRMAFSRETSFTMRKKALLWAVRHGVDAVVLPLWEKAPALFDGLYRRSREGLIAGARGYGLEVELGGWDLSGLLGRSLLKRRFSGKARMEEGRAGAYNFCPTSPESLAGIRAGAERYFSRPGDVRIFHLWPDRGAEDRWCSCPSCRAFSRNEQNRIAVNAAADVLAEHRPDALVSCYETAGDDGDAGQVKPRPNMFRAAPSGPAPDWALSAGILLF